MANVHIDICDYLDELSDEQLQAELDSRKKYKLEERKAFIKLPDAEIAIIEAADFCRAKGRIDLGFKLDEIRNDFLDNG